MTEAGKKQFPLLEKINFPRDLKQLERKELLQLCEELREFIIEEMCHNPGHLGASLGVVELTVALHYVFDTPHDILIWDVGHQAYAHKILTGRRTLFHTNRKLGGISGFPRMAESEYDAFGTGHASTSVSAALGMATAFQLTRQNSRQCIAVIGDGALTGGQAFEALNNAGAQKTNLLVILNDNNMAIDPNVGAISRYLTRLSFSHRYNKFRNKVWMFLSRWSKAGPAIQRYIQAMVKAFKGIFFRQSNIFHALGFRYFGPVDGHNVLYLVHILEELKNIPGPKLLHCVTVKGKGYRFAEEDQTLWHAPGKFNKETGERLQVQEENSPPRYQDVFGQTLLELAQKDEKIVGITPAMPTGCSMNLMMAEMPHRVFDVGIAEPHAVTFSAGLAAQGMIPFCNIYSSFLQRSYDQVIHDVALQELPVIFCLDRAGLVGEDGPTHHGVFDIAAYRNVPNLIMASPFDETELRNLMYTAYLSRKPFMIRYPKGRGKNPDWRQPFRELPIGKGEKVREGKDIAILAYGPIGHNALEAAMLAEKEGISCAVYNMRFVKPMDTTLVKEVLSLFPVVITLEDGVIAGGFGSAVLELATELNSKTKIIRAGIPDQFISQGTIEELQRLCGLDSLSLLKVMKEHTGKISATTESNTTSSPEKIQTPAEKSRKRRPSGNLQEPTLF